MLTGQPVLWFISVILRSVRIYSNTSRSDQGMEAGLTSC